MANPFDAVTNSLKLTSASEQLQSLRAINDTLMAESLHAMQSGTHPGNGGGGGGGIWGAVGGALAGGLGLSSLISGVADLFGGGGSHVPTPPAPYMQPLPIQLDAGFSGIDGGAAFGTDFAQGGAPRAMTSAGTTSASPASASPTQITIQVQALDSKSFLDRSQDIAMAVRQAMLESTVLNDVIREV